MTGPAPAPATPMTVIHLVDDTKPGGVMRVIDHMTTAAVMTGVARHRVQVVRCGGALPDCAADVVVSHLTLGWHGLTGLIAFRARHAGVPLVHVEHSYTRAFAVQNVRAPRRFQTLLRCGYALFDRVVAVSAAQGRWMAEKGLVRGSALAVIPSAIDLSGFRALPRPRPTPRVIGAIGRLHRQKGFDTCHCRRGRWRASTRYPRAPRCGMTLR